MQGLVLDVEECSREEMLAFIENYQLPLVVVIYIDTPSLILNCFEEEAMPQIKQKYGTKFEIMEFVKNSMDRFLK